MSEIKNNSLPRLICNNEKTNEKVISEIEKNLKSCETFDFSVAFIADSGLAAIRQTLLDLRKQNKKGRIITSTYLGFNAPKMFYQLLELTNIEVRIFCEDGFHPKGYIFNSLEEDQIIIGSANLTQSALTVNQEWNVCVSSKENVELIKKIKDEFNEQWNKSIPLTIEWIQEYERLYKPLESVNYTSDPNNMNFKPNIIQVEALYNLAEMRNNGKDKALLISATGTGKTYLSAFDAKQFNAERLLFVVHRENIARSALKAFQNINKDKKCGIFTGVEKNFDADYIFCTIQTLGKREYLEKFNRDSFDYIIIDEVHHAAANSYSDLLNYFKPKFLLGMTATPERTDNAEEIYRMFEYNIAYEIRLKQAMKYDLLCPFNYYGISDLTIDGEEIDDKSEINKLADERRAEHIIQAIHDYKYSGDKVHGLIFVSSVEEAKSLSTIFNRKGFRTIALTGENNDEYRRVCIERLESENDLDYIFTVDIFNEGIDIPCVNQVVMARPTQSAIIFVQQLGRGLRKYDGKEYVNVIDIIGNYTNSFMIPIALSGLNDYNKDTLRKFVYDGNRMICGSSTVSFDEITKKRIYDKVDKAKFNTAELIRTAYKDLRTKLGHIPSLLDFDKFGSIDPVRIFDTYGSYHKLLKDVKAEKNYHIEFNDLEEEFLEFISKKFGSGKRIHELIVLKQLIQTKVFSIKNLEEELLNEYNVKYRNDCTQTIINEFTHNFMTGSNRNSYSNCIFIENNKITNTFEKLLGNNEFVKEINEIIEFGISRYKSRYSNTYQDTDLVLYEKYTYDDVCRLLNWEKSEVALNIGGYKYDKYSNTFPVFINYNKESVSATIAYEDHFVDKSHLIAISKSKRTLESDDVKTIIKAKENNTKIHLFVRKNKEDKDLAKEFYYLGLMNICAQPEQFVMKNTTVTAVEFIYQLDTPVRDDVYEYVTER